MRVALPDPSAWPITFHGEDTLPGALGHHALGKTPFGIVGVKQENWRQTAMYELLELLANPRADLLMLYGRILIPRECADPVEDDSDAGSNFVLPSYFVSGSDGPWDADDHLTGPISADGVAPMTPGGYVSTLDTSNVTAGWVQVDARGVERVPAAHTRTVRLAAKSASVWEKLKDEFEDAPGEDRPRAQSAGG